MNRQHRRGPWVEGADMSVRYRQGSANVRLPLHNLFLKSEKDALQTQHGPAQAITLVTAQDSRGVRVIVTFLLPKDYPLLLWRLTLENRGRRPILVDRLEMLNIGFRYAPEAGFTPAVVGALRGARQGHLILASELGDPAFFSNGWQSWNHTGVYGWQEKQRRTRLGPFSEPMRINAGTPSPRRRGLFSSDMYGVIGDRRHRTGLLAGFLSQKQHFGSLETLLDPASPALRMWANGDGARLDPGQEMTTDWACLSDIHPDSPDPLKVYLEAAGRENQVDPPPAPAEVPAGWCSWYQFFQQVSEQDILANLAELEQRAELPLQLVQIDDGYEAQVGDWNDFSPSFPSGVAPLAKTIHNAGFTPGLWLAPLIAHPKSKLAHSHPEWLLRSRFGRPVNAGFIWDTFTTALDLTAPGALEYAAESVARAAHEWDFKFLKLDFLYAGALPGRYRDPTRTRAQILRSGLEALRQAAGPETMLLGCGCPLGSALGLVESMRIGSDVDVRWKPRYKGVSLVFQSEPDMPSARNAIHNTLTRAPLHRRWWVNDPDCLLLRPTTELTGAEVQALASVIALSGGSLLLSDHLPEVPEDRMQIAGALLPLIGRRPYVLDWFDSSAPERLQVDLEGAVGAWHLLGLFNWQDRPRDLRLKRSDFYLESGQEYLFHSFWDGQVYRLPARSNEDGPEDELLLPRIPAHGGVVLAARRAAPHLPQFLGSSLHISQGQEVTGWEWDGEQNLFFRLERPGRAVGRVCLHLPGLPSDILLNGEPIQAVPLNSAPAGVYALELDFNQTAELTLKVNLNPHRTQGEKQRGQ
jgi:alpha-galactosidase